MRLRVRHPEYVLAAAVLVSTPMIPGILDGAVSLERALVQFLLALLACWVAGGVISSLLVRYANESRRKAIIKMIADQAEKRREAQERLQNLETDQGSANGAPATAHGTEGVGGVTAGAPPRSPP